VRRQRDLPVGIARLLEAHDLRVVAEAGSREAALDVAGARGIDVVLVDVGLPPAPEAALAVIAAARRTGAIPIAIGAGGTAEAVFAAIRAGAAGYLTKDLPGTAWAGAIKAATRGEAPLSRAMTAQLVQRFCADAAHAPLPRPRLPQVRSTRRPHGRSALDQRTGRLRSL
jgi:DNA-binding NarL/FixJ family response regulator